MIEEINNYLKRFLYLGDDEATVLSAWALHTWQFEVGRPVVTPYIYLNSTEPGCGKSVALDILETLTRNACQTASITPSALYRQIQELHSTILLDEIDTIFYGRKNEDMRNVVNSGYKISGKRAVTSGGVSVTFSTFCPKIMAGIYNGQMPETIADRCIPITLDKKPEEVELEYFADFLFADDAEALLQKMVVWSEENADRIMDYRFWQVPGLSPRQSEVAWQLMAIGHADGVDLEGPIRRLFAKHTEQFTAKDSILAKIAEYFDENLTGKVHLESLVEALDIPVTLANIKKLSKQISDSYNIDPKNVRIGTSVRRGYDALQFADVFKKNSISMKNVAV